jgi:uncharacterized hydantoinase/oxoprolinase family protein
MTHNGKSRTDLARQASVVRSKLLRTVEQLDQRRQQVRGMRVEVEEKLKSFAATAALVLIASVGAAAYTFQRVAGAAARRRRARWRLARQVWVHPERAMRGERRSFLGEVVRSLLLAIATTAVTIPARRAVSLLIEGRGEKRGGGQAPSSP